MISVNINNQSYFFSVGRITKQYPDKLIYSINLNDKTYFLSKTVGINDCKQIDSYAKLDEPLFNELCDMLTEIEQKYKKRPSVDFINKEIFRILGRMRSARLKGRIIPG